MVSGTRGKVSRRLQTQPMSTEPFASATDCNAAEPAATAIYLTTTRRSLRVLFLLSLRRH